MTFGHCTRLYNRTHNQDTEQFPHPKKVPLVSVLSHLSWSQASGKHYSSDFLTTSPKRNITHFFVWGAGAHATWYVGS